MQFFSAGVGPTHVIRLVQTAIALPVAWSFAIGILEWDVADPLLDLAASVGIETSTARWGLAAVAVALEVSEQAVQEAQNRFATRLHELLKSIGDLIRDGAATESAVAEATRNGTGPATLLRDALAVAEDMPFESALRAVADTSGRPYFQEVAYLVAMAIDSPGDVGQAIRTLGSDLERTERLGSTLEAAIFKSTMVLKAAALVMVPPMFALLTSTFQQSVATEGDVVAGPAYTFFAYGAFVVTALDGIVYDRWGSVLPRLPLAMALVYGGLSVV